MSWDRSKYPDNWEEISLAIKERDGWQCRWCNAAYGDKQESRKGQEYSVVLVVAHLGVPYPDGRPGNKHDKRDCRPENLATLCLSCHALCDAGDRGKQDEQKGSTT